MLVFPMPSDLRRELDVLYRGQRYFSIPDFMIGYQRPFKNAARMARGSVTFWEVLRETVHCLARQQ
jgi:hypothetical protein